jgi:hypothetical protein
MGLGLKKKYNNFWLLSADIEERVLCFSLLAFTVGEVCDPSYAGLLFVEVMSASWADCGFFEHSDLAVVIPEVF